MEYIIIHHIWVAADQKVAYVAPNQKGVPDMKLYSWLFWSFDIIYVVVDHICGDAI